jgi:hypothetical protein
MVCGLKEATHGTYCNSQKPYGRGARKLHDLSILRVHDVRVRITLYSGRGTVLTFKVRIPEEAKFFSLP